MRDRVDDVCKVLCKSGKFETGEGTCALVCMGMLGDARKGCAFRRQVHEKLAQTILDAVDGSAK